MPRLILVKHSSPEIVPTLPASLWRLSESGRVKCKPLAKLLAAYQPGVIVASTEPKALETAQIIADVLGRPVETAEELREHDRSNIVFTSTEKFEAAVARFFQEPQHLVMGRETADQAHRRFAAVVDTIMERHPGETVAVVTHGTVMALFVARAAAKDPFPLWKRLDTPAFVVLSLPEREVMEIVDRV